MTLKALLHMVLILVTAVIFYSGRAVANDPSDKSFKIMGNTFPPFGYPNQKQELEGFSIDLFKAVLEEAGYDVAQQSIRHAPFVRIVKEVETTPYTVGLHVARTPDRENRFKWIGPYYTISMGLIARKDRHITISALADLEKYRIATVTNTAPEQLLKKLTGLTLKIDSSSRPDAAIQKLIRGRADLIGHVHAVVNTQLHDLGQDINAYEQVYTLQKGELYFAAHKDLPAATRLKLQQALERLKDNGTWLSIKEQHHLP